MPLALNLPILTLVERVRYVSMQRGSSTTEPPVRVPRLGSF